LQSHEGDGAPGSAFLAPEILTEVGDNELRTATAATRSARVVMRRIPRRRDIQTACHHFRDKCRSSAVLLRDDVAVREAVLRLVSLGPMPSEESADEEVVAEYQATVEQLTSPASDEEAAALVPLLPMSGDSLFGLAWTLVHFIESSPGWPDLKVLGDDPWTRVLRERAAG
jgi:hypothetical protein